MIYQSLVNCQDIVNNHIFLFLVSDCFGWKAEIQREFPAGVPVDEGANIHDVYSNSCDIDHTCSHDDTRHNCVHPCLYANRLGYALGK